MSWQIRRKEAFHVMYRYHSGSAMDVWRDYFGRPLTYMAACEQVEKLKGESGDKYEFKVLHHKLLGKAA